MDGKLLLDVIKRETEKSTGCTDPGSVCLAVARAVHELGGACESVEVTVSANLFKNGASVGVPGTGQRGLAIAAAMGVYLHDHSVAGLHILDHVTPRILEQANGLIRDTCISVTCAETPDPLFVKARAMTAEGYCEVVIMYDYSNIVSICINGQTTVSNQDAPSAEAEETLAKYCVEDLYMTAQSLSFEDARFLLDFAQSNQKAAEAGIQDESLSLGRLLAENAVSQGQTPYTGASYVQAMTAAAGEARMLGLLVPVIAIAGSGNHGITNFLGVSCLAQALHADSVRTARALAISSAITIYIKSYIKRMTAFCGCSVAAATGVAAGSVYLLGGTFKQAEQAMNTVIGTLGGMFCDGAKESCAYKLSTAATMAVQFAYLAIRDCGVPPSEGIVGKNIEETFSNMGRLNNPGMVETDRLIVKIIEERMAQSL